MGGYGVQEGHAIAVLFVEVHVSAVFAEGEVGVGVELGEDGVEEAGGFVEVEGVRGADVEVDFSFEPGAALGPGGFEDVGEVVVSVPVGDDLGVYVAGGAVEHGFGFAVGAAG